jgi:hypothetical protein
MQNQTQKTALAKLLATENLSVEHQKIQTAKFDTKNRVLYLPIWKDMNGDLYDYLTGHEVGHALDTPADGWHDAVSDQSKGRGYKSFLNVIEDARIEKRQKRRYPGLRVPFLRGFESLMERDFFGLATRDINAMSFIDRLNVYTKSQYTADIQFKPEEQEYVERTLKLETWNDVVRLADDVYEYSKEEQFEMQQQMRDFESGDDSDDYEELDLEEDENGSLNSSGFESSEFEDKGLGTGESNEDDSKNDDQESEETSKKLNNYKNSNYSMHDQFSPGCETDDNFRANEGQLLDEKCKNYRYFDLPEPVMQNLVTPARVVNHNLSKFFQSHRTAYSEASINEWTKEFKNKNEKFVNLLVKEFEMRKAAKAYNKAKISDTGELDYNKLSSYKFEDNIFRKVVTMPKGKNHGLILLLDKSGSMSDNMAGSIEQVLVLAMFCRKVNIPFKVFGFTDAIAAIAEDMSTIEGRDILPHDAAGKQYFKHKKGTVSMRPVRLREYMNSQMPAADFSKAFRNLISVKRSFEKSLPRPVSEYLSNTPLNQAIYVCGYLMKEFKKKHNLDLASLAIVHDGEADYTGGYVMQDNPIQEIFFDYTYSVNHICDRKHKFEMRLDSRTDMTSVFQKWFRHVTGGAKIFGFFLAPGRMIFEAIRRYHIPKMPRRQENVAAIHEIRKQFNKDKFLDCANSGYDGFFLISAGSSLMTSDENMEIDGKVTTNRLKTAFMKYNKSKTVNRILVTTFVSKMAVH